MVVSNEPGYYKEGEFGIRTENLIFVKQVGEVDGKKLFGFENLTFVPIDTRLLDQSLLTENERDWLNTYHKEVLDKITPMVNEEVLAWLKEAAKPV